MYNLSLVLVVLVFSSDIEAEFVTIESTIETTRRGGSSRYRCCRCRTLLYLPCIFRLRTETIWVSATLRILIFEKLIMQRDVMLLVLVANLKIDYMSTQLELDMVVAISISSLQVSSFKDVT